MAWSYLDEEGARRHAGRLDAEAADGRLRGPLHGVPIGVKDVFHVAGMPTTVGAAEFAHSTPDSDALCVARLRAAGAVIVGKTTTTEMAYFEPSATRNPWNTGHTPGGSSSGSAAAVAAQMVPAALGSQTIGSVLRPAAFCGVIGYKGTHGLVPGDGVVPLAGLSLDHVGTFGRTVRDVELLMGIMAGRPLIAPDVWQPRFSIAPELLDRAEPAVADAVAGAAARFEEAGAIVTQVGLPESFAAIHDAGQAILAGEFSTSQAGLFRQHAASYRQRTRDLIESGLSQRTHEYVAAQITRAALQEEMRPILQEFGSLLLPSAPGTAPAGLDYTGDPWFCAPWSSIGYPAISLPNGTDAQGLPHAVQVVGLGGADASLLALARWCEEALDPIAFPGQIPTH